MYNCQIRRLSDFDNWDSPYPCDSEFTLELRIQPHKDGFYIDKGHKTKVFYPADNMFDAVYQYMNDQEDACCQAYDLQDGVDARFFDNIDAAVPDLTDIKKIFKIVSITAI